MVCKAKKGVNEEAGKASKGIFVFVFLRPEKYLFTANTNTTQEDLCVKSDGVHRFQALLPV